MRYEVKDWDGNSVIFPNWRKAKAALRIAERESYCASIRAYHGPRKAFSWVNV